MRWTVSGPFLSNIRSWPVSGTTSARAPRVLAERREELTRITLSSAQASHSIGVLTRRGGRQNGGLCCSSTSRDSGESWARSSSGSMVELLERNMRRTCSALRMLGVVVPVRKQAKLPQKSSRKRPSTTDSICRARIGASSTAAGKSSCALSRRWIRPPPMLCPTRTGRSASRSISAWTKRW